jgi:hypothetical protein
MIPVAVAAAVAVAVAAAAAAAVAKGSSKILSGIPARRHHAAAITLRYLALRPTRFNRTSLHSCWMPTRMQRYVRPSWPLGSFFLSLSFSVSMLLVPYLASGYYLTVTCRATFTRLASTRYSLSDLCLFTLTKYPSHSSPFGTTSLLTIPSVCFLAPPLRAIVISSPANHDQHPHRASFRDTATIVGAARIRLTVLPPIAGANSDTDGSGMGTGIGTGIGAGAGTGMDNNADSDSDTDGTGTGTGARRAGTRTGRSRSGRSRIDRSATARSARSARSAADEPDEPEPPAPPLLLLHRRHFAGARAFIAHRFAQLSSTEIPRRRTRSWLAALFLASDSDSPSSSSSSSSSSISMSLEEDDDDNDAADDAASPSLAFQRAFSYIARTAPHYSVTDVCVVFSSVYPSSLNLFCFQHIHCTRARAIFLHAIFALLFSAAASHHVNINDCDVKRNTYSDLISKCHFTHIFHSIMP